MEQPERYTQGNASELAAAPAPSRGLGYVLARRMWVVLQVAGAVFFAALVIGLLQPKIYRATAWILISEVRQRRESEIATPEQTWAKVQSEVPVHLRLIRRAEIADRVRDRLHLSIPSRNLLSAFQCEQVTKQSGSGTTLLALSFEDTDPERAQKVVNEWAKVYVQDSRDRGNRSLASALDYVENQLRTIGNELSSIEGRLAYVEQQHFQRGVDPAVLEQVRALQKEIANNEAEQAVVASQIERTRQLLATEPATIEEVQEEPTPMAQALEKQLAELHVQREKMLEAYYPDSPEVKALDEQIASIEKRLADVQGMYRSVVKKSPNPLRARLRDSLASLQAQLKGLQSRGAALRQQLAQLQAAAEGVPQAQLETTRYERRQKALEDIHSMLMARSYELQVEKAMALPNVQVVELAEVPTQPVKPKLINLAGIGLILGLLIGVTLAIIIDQIEDTFGDVDEVRSYTRMRLFGAMPGLANGRVEGLLVLDEPRSAYANAMRMLASALRIEMQRTGISHFIITSAGRGEGKSSLAANLAAALAAGGHRVLLIDADLHNPSLHRYFGVTNERGLTNVLFGQAGLGDVVVGTSVPGLSFLPSGPLPPSPADFLGSDQGAAVVKNLNEAEEVVIWDTPPAAMLPDAMVLGANVGACLFVVGRTSRRRAVVQALASLRDAGMQVLGIAANGVRPAAGRYDYYYYYYYYYGYDERDKRRRKNAQTE